MRKWKSCTFVCQVHPVCSWWELCRKSVCEKHAYVKGVSAPWRCKDGCFLKKWEEFRERYVGGKCKEWLLWVWVEFLCPFSLSLYHWMVGVWKSEMEKTNLKGVVQALQKAEIDSHAHLGCSLQVQIQQLAWDKFVCKLAMWDWCRIQAMICV